MSQLPPWVVEGFAWLLAALLLPAFLGMSPWLAKKLVNRAARRLPPGHQERYQEEWTAEIEAMGNGAGIGPLVFALLWYAKSWQMAEITSRAPTTVRDRPLVHHFPVLGEGLLGKATGLFSEHGIKISIDRVISGADVAPMTLYRRFRGKDDLVVASLTMWSARWLEALAEQVKRYGDDPRAQYEGLWEVLEQWFASEHFHGSFVANAALELRGDRHHPAYSVIAAHRRAEHAFLEQLARAAGARDSAGCATQLQMLLNGTIEAATVDRRPEMARQARELAMAIL
jgi:AcrR family transcriptional regulator